MLIPLFVIPATMQWFVLHKSARNAWLWIVAGAVSALTFGVLYGDLNDNELRQFVLGAAAQGAVTGLSLLWLYGQSRAEKAKVAAS
jgi:undecaprenyl pyrophosphate phosphatase UppP